MFQLPDEFLCRMKEMLKEEFQEFFNQYKNTETRAIRVNTLKSSAKKLVKLLEFPVEPSPFSPDSFLIPSSVQGLGRHPLHHAGAYYVQEPSAASAVTVLCPAPGDRVLDLCAAPGGKSTQIAAKLQGKGLLWSNEIVKNRARILLSNIERMGVRNAVVSSCHPDPLCERLAGFFDKVLVDAPCSGEGMFRKDPKASEEWSLAHTAACAQRQLAILHSAAQAVREGGVMVYSTCTFAPVENEGVISHFLKEHADFILEDAEVSFGRPACPGFGNGEEKLRRARRIYPMDGGEGHFVAKLRRMGPNSAFPDAFEYVQAGKDRALDDLWRNVCKGEPYGKAMRFRDSAVLLPEGLPELSGLGVLRAGVQLGEVKKSRIEPAHALYMAARPEELTQTLELSLHDPRLEAFLRGEEIPVDPSYSGYTGVSVEGIVTGFGKCSGGRLKNRYPKGLRNF